jgi:ATP-dependent DNA helicase RecQ
VKRTLETSVEKLYDKINYFLKNKHGLNYNDEIAMYTGDAKDSQEAFMKDEKTLLIATKAFGMGIDKPNIRMTVHFGMPSSREAFYQEAGRAGRDGKASKCLLYAINPNDFDIDNNVKKFLNPNTSVYDMKNILRYLTRKRVDIATAFYFFLDSYEEPDVERDKSLLLLERLKQHNNYKISLYKEDKKSTEKYLYI